MLRRTTWTKPGETAETKAVKTCMTSYQGAQDLRGWPAVVDSQRSAWRRRTPGNARKAIRLENLASVGDLAKNQGTKEKARPSTASAFVARLSLMRRQTDGTNRQKARGQAGGTAWQAEDDMV